MTPRRRLRPLSLLLPGLLALGVPSGPARAQAVFPIDERFGAIDFSVDHFGLFTSHGGFHRFSGTLAIDTARPEMSRIAVSIEAGSVDMDSPDGLSMVRSADYFDVAAHPVIAFQSSDVTQTSPDHYRVAGMITIRDVTRPMVLDAVLTGHTAGPLGPESDFEVAGSLNRLEFGMVANRNFVSDTVQLHIVARIGLDHPPPLPPRQATAAPRAG